MSEVQLTFRSHLTLASCTVLHAFTHAYQVLLVPLYLLIVADLNLKGVQSVALVITIYNIIYCVMSYPAGVYADRANRKVLLGLGLIVNAIAFLLMGWVQSYPALLLLGVLAGLAGTIFHPAANALVTAHYPRTPGMAIGLLGIGAGIGFFAGPQYAGWRAEHAGWHQPCIDLGVAGIVFGVLFLLIAWEAHGATPAGAQSNSQPAAESARRSSNGRAAPLKSARTPMGRTLRRRVVLVALLLCLRDFTGVATLTLASVYLQKALGRSVQETGFILGAMMLIAVLVNPLLVWLSPGGRRLPILAAVLIGSGITLASVPYWHSAYVLPVLCTFQAFHLGTYAVSEAAMLERVAPAVRGRVVGMFLTVAGTIASTSPWIIGAWTDALGARAAEPMAYALPFGVLGALIALAATSVFAIARLGERPEEPVVEPVTEIVPGIMEATP